MLSATNKLIMAFVTLIIGVVLIGSVASTSNLVADKNYISREYVNLALHASGIRDTYLREEYTKNNLLLIFTTPEVIHKADQIFETHNKIVENGCFYIRSTSEYTFLKATDMKGMKAGIEIFYDLLKQTLDDYFNQKKFDDFIKIRPFEIYSCI